MRHREEICEHGVLRNMQCEECEAEAKAKTAVPTCYVRAVLKGGQGYADIPQGANFNFTLFCTLVKGDGALKTESSFIPWENILMLLLINDPNSTAGLPQTVLDARGPPRGAKSN